MWAQNTIRLTELVLYAVTLAGGAVGAGKKKYNNNSLNYEVKYQLRGTPSDHVQVYVRFMNRGISSVLLSR